MYQGSASQCTMPWKWIGSGDRDTLVTLLTSDMMNLPVKMGEESVLMTNIVHGSAETISQSPTILEMHCCRRRADRDWFSTDHYCNEVLNSSCLDYCSHSSLFHIYLISLNHYSITLIYRFLVFWKSEQIHLILVLAIKY